MSSDITKINAQICSNTKVVQKQKQIKAELGTLQAEKILSVSAVPHISTKKADTNKAYVEGYIYYTVLYSSLDLPCESMNYKADFNEQIDLPDLTPDSHIIISTQLLEVEPKPIKDDGVLSVNTTINLRACAVFTESIECVDIESVDSTTLCTKVDETTLSTVLGSGDRNFEVGNRIELGKNYSKVVNLTATLSGVDYYCTESTLVANGQITTNALYQTTDENHPLMHKSTIYDFKHEIEIDGVSPDVNVLANMSLVADGIEIEADEDTGELIVNYPMAIDYILLEKCKLKTVIDAYSVDKEIKISTTSQNNIQFLPLTKLDEQIHTSLILDKEYESIEKIIGYNSDNVVITKAIAEQDAINFEGIAYADILYLSYDHNTEQKTNSSIIAEMPFSFKLNLLGITADDEVILRAKLADFDARVKRAQEIDVFAQMKVQVFGIKRNIANLTTALEFGEEKLKSNAGLSIYLVEKGTSAWDIAKKLSITTDELAEQNPTLVFPLENNEKVILYRQIKNRG